MIIMASILILGMLGFIFAGLLGLAADYFKIEEDPRVVEILKILPGSNCGACGFAGCSALAQQIAAGTAPTNACTAGGNEVAQKIAALLGGKTENVQKKLAAVHCGASSMQRKLKANYYGIEDCAAANMVDGGGLLCAYGCLGYGDCQKSCTFGAIAMQNGLPVINLALCTGCGKCVSACPREIITLRPAGFPVVIACASHERGGATRKICEVGCIACKICEKEVPEVFSVVDNLAVINYNKTETACASAILKCPPQCIHTT
jgi:Na+-translocating ferredoxin:NAD+ oxidoreductase RNF subunit RnfB